ncbi:30 kDa heat shock protein [Golovinomyces cichoracearum]|uniref:30 kDa heat shock protein n=1 Tax=Golovinomyces cichoracearum TaxID=62708 RepID=A0A420I9J7_9PEZI|nr:30 kDa heat shock protein [Golovinomyces cichoracearum]
MFSKTLRPSRPLRILKKSLKKSHATPLCMRRKISMLPKTIFTKDHTEFPPIFRLLEEFDKYSRSVDQPTTRISQFRSFTPKFDVKELPESYELYGELPGIDQKDIEIEFTDTSTLTISGHTQRTHTQGSEPIDFTEDGNSQTSDTYSPERPHDKTFGNVDSQKSLDKPNDTSKSKVTEESEEKFWVMERSVGEFSRSFTFPAQVDEENVTASMSNGVLTVIVPKTKKQSVRKITIQ